jgi:hypothetical protein
MDNRKTQEMEAVAMSDLFGEPIYAYTRRQAVEDGQQVAMNQGAFSEFSQRFFNMPVFCTVGVFAALEESATKRRPIALLWHDLALAAANAIRVLGRGCNVVSFPHKVARLSATTRITVECGATDIDDPRPCLCIMLPEER